MSEELHFTQPTELIEALRALENDIRFPNSDEFFIDEGDKEKRAVLFNIIKLADKHLITMLGKPFVYNHEFMMNHGFPVAEEDVPEMGRKCWFITSSKGKLIYH